MQIKCQLQARPFSFLYQGIESAKQPLNIAIIFNEIDGNCWKLPGSNCIILMKYILQGIFYQLVNGSKFLPFS